MASGSPIIEPAGEDLHRRPPRRRGRVWSRQPYSVNSTKLVLTTVLLLALASAGGIASYEGLTATATNPGASPYNNFSTGTVSITDNEASTAMFSVSNADPPATGSACIGVQYTGTVTSGSDVYLYATNVSSTSSLDSYITLSVQDGTDTATFGTGDPTCSTFTANTDTTAASHTTTGNAVTAADISSWPTTDSTGYSLSSTGSGTPVTLWTTNPTTVWYKFTYSIASGAPAASTAALQLTWEADGQ